MSIYLPSPNDLFLIDLREWCKNNPLTEKDFVDSIISGWNSKFGFQKGMIPWNKGKTPSEETKIKCGLAAKRKVVTPKMRENYKNSKLGKNNPNFNKPITEETKEKIRKKMLGKKLPKHSNWHKNNDHHTKHQVICPHCKKEGNSLAMKRWHFNKCKNYSSSSSS